MAEEIWTQTGGRIDAFVQSVGTAASLRGIAEGLRRARPGHPHRRRRAGRVAGALGRQVRRAQDRRHRRRLRRAAVAATAIADRIERVSTEEAMAMAMRLAREEGLFAGTSTGANVVAALRLAEQLGPGATVVTRDVRHRDEVPEQVG